VPASSAEEERSIASLLNSSSGAASPTALKLHTNTRILICGGAAEFSCPASCMQALVVVHLSGFPGLIIGNG